jgi:hypothetical protein
MWKWRGRRFTSRSQAPPGNALPSRLRRKIPGSDAENHFHLRLFSVSFPAPFSAVSASLSADREFGAACENRFGSGVVTW